MRPIFVLTASIGLIASLANAQTVLITADTEGHTEQCQTCPMHVGHGGIARRATAIGQARTSGDVLLLDAGNFLFGAESADSKGKVIVAAYDALAYDAVNLSYRDFRLGKAQTLELLKDAKFAAVSANLLDDASGQPLAKPYVVKKLGDKRIAILGVCEAPPGMQYLPALKQQLAGIRVRAIDESLAEWLPKARAEADQVVVLYYGSAHGLAQIEDKWQADIWAIGIGGINAELPANNSGPAIIVAEEHGKSLGRLPFAAGSHPDQLDITPTIDASENARSCRILCGQAGCRGAACYFATGCDEPARGDGARRCCDHAAGNSSGCCGCSTATRDDGCCIRPSFPLRKLRLLRRNRQNRLCAWRLISPLTPKGLAKRRPDRGTGKRRHRSRREIPLGICQS